MSEHMNTIEVSLARHPIFDSNQRLWGYELIPVCTTGRLAPADTDSMAFHLAASTYMGLQPVLDRGQTLMVRFAEKSILDEFPYALPPGRTAVKIAVTAGVDDKLATSVQRLREDGYQIVLSPGHEGGPEDALLPLADVISTRVADLNRDQLEALHRKFASGSGRLLAARVQSQSVFKACRDVGFDLFQGSFFKQPEKISMDKISSSEASRFQLLRMIEQEDPDFSELSEIIGADVSISLRLLSYINSAAFGLRRKVQSIHEAITMLGWQHIKNWLRILVLSDAARNQNASELMLLSAQRGKFLEQVAEDHDFWGFNPERLFLLGLFSLTDAMLNRSMVDIVRHLPLDETLKSALCRQKNNELLPFIHLAECFEDARWDEADTRVQALGLDTAKTNTAFQKAVNWASDMATVTA